MFLRPFVPPTKIQAAVKPRPFLHKVAAANPEYEKSLLQVLKCKFTILPVGI